MLKDNEIAEEYIKRQFIVISGLELSLIDLKDRVSDEEYNQYRLEIGKLIYGIWDGIINPLLAAHPSLDIDKIISEMNESSESREQHTHSILKYLK